MSEKLFQLSLEKLLPLAAKVYDGGPITLIGQDGYTTVQRVGKKWQATTRRSEEGKTTTLYESLEEALEWFMCNVYAAGYRIKF